MLKRVTIALAASLAATLPAFAHLNPNEHGSFLAGFSHPLTGTDHILAMVGVGVWAALVGGRAVWIVPAAFVGTMAAGFASALVGFPLPFAEPVILASVVALGLLVAAAVRLPTALCALVVGAFALFHGSAHATEMGFAGAAGFGTGFVLATALLHAAGLALGLWLAPGSRRQAGAAGTRLVGAGTVVAGLLMIAA